MSEQDNDQRNGFSGDVLAVVIYLAAVVMLALVVLAVLTAANARPHNAPARMDAPAPAR